MGSVSQIPILMFSINGTCHYSRIEARTYLWATIPYIILPKINRVTYQKFVLLFKKISFIKIQYSNMF